MQLTLLGSVQVHWETGSPPRYRSQRTVALLGYLVTEQRAISREHLAALFWPDEDPSKGKANLRRELHNLAQILPGCWQTSRVEVEFVSGVDTAVDIYQFLDYEKAEQWQAAADLIGGAYLEAIVLADNLEFETWLLGEQERWRQRFVTVLKSQIERYSLQQQYSEALPYIYRLLPITPWDEEAHQQAMLFLAKTGQYKAAIKQFKTCRQLLDEELSVEPSTETLALHRRIQAAEASPGHTLPAQTTALIGREADLITITDYLANPDCRLLTLVGPGGIGKTRLAIATAERLHQHYLEGAFFVSLLSITSVESVVGAVAETLQLDFQEGSPPREQLLAYLRTKELLLVLDNLEQLLSDSEGSGEGQAMVQLLEEILTTAAEVKIMVTSREVVNSNAEQVYPVRGLPVANSSETTDIAIQPAVALFLSRAQRVRGHAAEWNGDELISVADICQLVEGMPLAIELAAAQVRLYSPSEIEVNLRQNLDILQTSTRGLNQRHQSMRAVFDVSWQSLKPDEQQVLAQLSTFFGGFTRQAAVEIVQARTTHLSVLLDKSLIMGGPSRFELHTLLQQFTAEMLPGIPEEKRQVRQRHFDYYRHLLNQAISAWNSTKDLTQLDILKGEAENLHSAWNWISEQDNRREAITYLEKLWQYFIGRHRYPEAIRFLSLALERTPDEEVAEQFALLLARENAYDKLGDRQAQALDLERLKTLADQLDPLEQGMVALRQANYAEVIGQYTQAVTQAQKAIHYGQQADNKITLAEGHYRWGRVLNRQANYAAAQEHFQTGLHLAKEDENQKQTANCYHGLGSVAYAQDNFDEAIAYHEQALAIRQEFGDRQGEARSLRYLGIIVSKQGGYLEAITYYEQSLAIYREIRDRLGEGKALRNLEDIFQYKGNFAKASTYGQQALIIAREIGNRSGEASILNGLGDVAWSQGNYGRANSYYQQALAIFDEIGDRIGEMSPLRGLGLVANDQGDYGAAINYHKRVLFTTREIGNHLDEAACLANLGLVSWKRGDYLPAKNYYEQSLLITREIGFPRGEAIIFTNSGHLAYDQGKYIEAKTHYEKALTIVRQMDILQGEGIGLNGLGWIYLALQQPALAESHFQQAQTIRKETEQPQLLVEDWAGLAQVQLILGNETGAWQHSQQIVHYLKENPGLHGAENPVRTFRYIWEGLLALEQSVEAHKILSPAIQLMHTYLNKVDDSAAKEMYLSQPHHQVLWQAWNRKDSESKI